MEKEEKQMHEPVGVGFYVGVCLHLCKREGGETQSVLCLIRLMRHGEAGRFNIPIDPSSPCYTLTFTAIQLRQ